MAPKFKVGDFITVDGYFPLPLSIVDKVDLEAQRYWLRHLSDDNNRKDYSFFHERWWRRALVTFVGPLPLRDDDGEAPEVALPGR